MAAELEGREVTDSLIHHSECARCEGTGKIVDRYDHLDEKGEVVGHTSTTRACKCVDDLPPVNEQAGWWTLDKLMAEHFVVPIFNDVLTVDVSTEVPRRADGRRCLRTLENCYWPTLIEVEGPAKMTLHADTARELGELLIRAADIADKADVPVEVESA